MPNDTNAPDLKTLRRVVADVTAEIDALDEHGESSKSLPELENVDPDLFGMAVLTCDGDMVTGGNADTAFPIQSISKVFSLTLALEAFGKKVWRRVGREPSGDPYNSIVDLERHEGIPRNPFINAGALVVVDILLGRKDDDGVPASVRAFLEKLLDGEEIALDEDVADSAASSGFINRALANLAKSFDNLDHDVEEVMAAYIEQCSLKLTCRQLAKAGRYLMLDRASTDVKLRDARRARRINSLMLTCGQYDGSGDFAFRVGLPAKSGVAGGILAIVPNCASIAVWSPGLDANGNSLLGTAALERLSERMDWSVFGAVGRDYEPARSRA